MDERGLTFIDFFAGIGGFRLGMERAGHKCVGHCEIDKYADKSYRAMYKPKGDEWYADDIFRVEPNELPEADVWCGGFPCQAFSIAGKRRGFEDMRGTLIFEIFRLASKRKPEIIFLENVAGLLTHEQGKTFATILSGFWELGYDVEWQLLNTKNFGIPHNRERAFIIGYSGGNSGRKVFPLGNGGKEVDELQRLLTNTITARITADATGTYAVENQQFSQKIKQVGNIDQHRRKRENPHTGRVYAADGISPCLSTMQGGGLEPKIVVSGIYTGTSDTFRRPPLKNISRRLKAKQHDAGVVLDDRIRRLTPLECFRLQGFPDELFYKAQAVNSDRQLYKQTGNSVTVKVVEEVAKRLKV